MLSTPKLNTLMLSTLTLGTLMLSTPMVTALVLSSLLLSTLMLSTLMLRQQHPNLQQAMLPLLALLHSVLPTLLTLCQTNLSISETVVHSQHQMCTTHSMILDNTKLTFQLLVQP